MLVERIALDAYNLEAMPAESPRIQNFIDGQFIEPLSGRYFGQHRAGDWKAVFTSRDEGDRCHNRSKKAERSHARSARVKGI